MSSAWQFYGIEMTAVSAIRTSFLLRVLVVDVQPFQMLLTDLLEDEEWQVRCVPVRALHQCRNLHLFRLQTVHRLFQIITDVTSPAFNVEDRQWRSSVIDIFHSFFSQLWLDAKVCGV